jgi:hypothetical protein
VTAQNAGYTNYDDNVMVSLYCESRDLTYKELGYAFLAVLIIVICMMYCFYRFLKMIIDHIQAQLQYVKWSEDKNEPFRKKYGYGNEWVFVMQVYREDGYIERHGLKKLTKKQRKFTHKSLITLLTDAGFETRMHYNLAHDTVFVKVRLAPEPMKKFADTIDYKMCLNPSKLRAKLEKGKKNEEKEWQWLPLELVDPLELSKYNHTDFIYGKYDTSPDLQDLYKHGSSQIFSGVDRIRLIMSKLETSKDMGGCGLSLRELTGAKKEADRVVLASFPLHEYRALQELKRKWLVLFQWPHKQPFDEIKDYFGTKIALYYVWLGKYTTWLLYASVVGVICYMGVATDEGAYNSPMVAIFALFMCLWTTLFMESWKNTQERKKQKWGTIGMEDEELERIQFIPMEWKGRCGYGPTEPEEDGIIPDPKTGQDMKYFPEDLMIRLQRESWVVIILLILGVVGITFGTMYLKVLSGDNNNSLADPSNLFEEVDDEKVHKWALNAQTDDEAARASCHGKDSGCKYSAFYDNEHMWSMFKHKGKTGAWILAKFNYGGIIVSVIRSGAIIVCGMLFDGVAKFLTERENHKTDTMFEDSLIAKSFLFNFVNSFFNLMFTAFIVINYRTLRASFCGPTLDCMTQVSNSLSTLVISKMVVGFITEAVLPYVKQRKMEKAAVEEAKRGKSADEKFMMEPATAVEEQYDILEEYDILYALYKDYLEMIIQYGYSTLFSAAFLFAPLLGFVNNYVEIRIDGWKMTTLCQRPYPKPAEDIGTWQTVMEIMSYAAIITNVALICFTSDILGKHTGQFHRWLCFLLIEHGMVGLKLLLMVVIDDIPEDILVQQQRQELYVAKVINNQEDDALDIAEYELEHEGKTIKRPKRSKPVLDVKATDYEYYVASETQLQDAEGAYEIDLNANM